ncbi:hypothetical protein [Methylobacterium mesophilicum]|uniref:hypothetical protein n=1 Tax=Methylobacterium mesophilicum TaxID=39956 RepID=UPI002F351558
MTRIRVKGFQIFADRHGVMRCYHRKTGEKIDLKKAPLGSAAFFAEVARIEKSAEAAAAPKGGTLGSLIVAYRAHAAFTDLAPQTRADYQKVLNYLKDIDGTDLSRFTRPFVVKIRDRAAERKGRRFGNHEGGAVAALRLGVGARPSAGEHCRRHKGSAQDEGRTRRQ